MRLHKRLLPLVGLFTIFSGTVTGQTVVHEMADGDFMVVDYRGKPPFKRTIVSMEDKADYQRLQTLENSVRVTSASTRRSGPAGKTFPGRKATIEYVDRDQVVNIARLEEVENNRSTRMWRGAPGKGRPVPKR